MLVEPTQSTPYLSVFITHFLSSPTKNTAILRKLYIDLDLRSRQIAEISSSNWSKTAIIEALLEANITRTKRNSRPKFGYKIVGGIHMQHQAEMKIIKKILSLKNQGLSLRAISQELSELGIQKRSGGKWDKTTIGIIIKRHEKEILL